MTLDLWMGIAIGMMVVIVTVVVFLLLMKPPTQAQRRNLDDANQLLRARNNIGVRQCEALEAIADVINLGGDDVDTIKLRSDLDRTREERNQILEVVEVIHMIATQPHHERALIAIRDITAKAKLQTNQHI